MVKTLKQHAFLALGTVLFWLPWSFANFLIAWDQAGWYGVIVCSVLLMCMACTYLVAAVFVAGKPVQRQSLGTAGKKKMGWIVGWALAVILVISGVLKGCDYMQVSLYENAIPAKIEIGTVLFHDEQSGLREGCGVAIFEISESSLKAIERHGLTYFEDATLGRDQDSYHSYRNWKQTPPTDRESEWLLRGASCINNTPSLWNEIAKAAYSSGSYFTTGSEQDLIVIPRLRVIVFSHNG